MIAEIYGLDEAPDFVALHAFAGDVAHRGVMERLTSTARIFQQLHDAVERHIADLDTPRAFALACQAELKAAELSVQLRTLESRASPIYTRL